MTMRSFWLLLAAGSAVALLSADAQACSARGTYCSYPDWAANAFEGPKGSYAKDQVDLEELDRPARRYGSAAGDRSRAGAHRRARQYHRRVPR